MITSKHKLFCTEVVFKKRNIRCAPKNCSPNIEQPIFQSIKQNCSPRHSPPEYFANCSASTSFQNKVKTDYVASKHNEAKGADSEHS